MLVRRVWSRLNILSRNSVGTLVPMIVSSASRVNRGFCSYSHDNINGRSAKG